MAVLSAQELDKALESLDGWSSDGRQLTKQFELGGFREAVAFVMGAAFEAESANHHPDIDIRYNKVTIVLSTHSEGGVTQKDVDLAAALDSLARA